MPKKKSTSKAKKTSKLQGLSQAHGKDETKEFQPTTLDQVWGDTGLWKYNTMNEDEYKDQLKQMSKADYICSRFKKWNYSY